MTTFKRLLLSPFTLCVRMDDFPLEPWPEQFLTACCRGDMRLQDRSRGCG